MTAKDPSDPTSAADLVIQGFTPHLKLSDFKLIARDMDSTLINIDCNAHEDNDRARLTRDVLKPLGMPGAMVAA